MTGFYLTLPSNSSMDYYPDNKISQFVTQLPQPIRLEGGWEVGLVEILYPHTWFNVPNDEADRTFSVNTIIDGEFVGYNFTIPKGFYTISSLLQHIEDAANRALNLTQNTHVQLYYDEASRTVSANLNNCELFIPDYIKPMLGINFESFNVLNSKSDSVIDMDPLQSMYVYCDLIEPQVVGDTMVPLLRVIPIEGNHGEMVCKTYQNVHYIPLQRKHFQTVEIYIRDDTGKKVPFECGKSIVTLHFRRKRTLL